jgi:hypothetical protein
MQRYLIPDLCRLVRSYLFDSVTLPSIKVTISGFANGLFYVTYKDITIATTLSPNYYMGHHRPRGYHWGWRFYNGLFRVEITAERGWTEILDERGYISQWGVYLSAEELGNLFTFVERQIN